MNVVKVISLLWSARKPLGWLVNQVRRKQKTATAITAVGVITTLLQGDIKMESLFSPEVISVVISGLLAVIGSVFGVKLIKFKKLAIDAVELVKAVADGLADGKLSPDEAKRISKELKDILDLFKGTSAN